jgi:hypothetical protein
MRGEEIMSGAQRIHDPEYLSERAKHHGIGKCSKLLNHKCLLNNYSIFLLQIYRKLKHTLTLSVMAAPRMLVVVLVWSEWLCFSWDSTTSEKHLCFLATQKELLPEFLGYSRCFCKTNF